ncbi:MAG: hypothetical protein AABZ45_09300 [Pseudomonadota bacterium]
MGAPDFMGEAGPVPLGATIAEARAFLRMGAGVDDAVLAGLLRSATAQCEQFTGLALVAREVKETQVITGAWQRLALFPVSAITSAEGVPAEGAAFALGISDYAIDLDCNGAGWVKVAQQGAAGRVRVTYRAGIAGSAGEVPDSLRQGIIMTAAYLHRARDGDGDGAIPAAVRALWQPFRRMRLS